MSERDIDRDDEDFPADPAAGADAGSPRLPPRSLLLMFCGAYLFEEADRAPAFSGSIVEILARVGVGEHTVRAALARMVRRGLLQAHRSGKRAYFGLTEQGRAVLGQGQDRIRAGLIRDWDWDGEWTLLGFSLPEERRAERTVLRSRLVWNGFGLLQKGMWVAPGRVDAETVLDGLDLGDHVRVFGAYARHPTDVADMIREAWDLDGIARRYQRFLDRWDHPDPMPDAADDLARQILLMTEWLLLVRADPHLPVAYLPPDWPAVRARHVMERLRVVYRHNGRQIAAGIIQRLPTAPSEAGRQPVGQAAGRRR